MESRVTSGGFSHDHFTMKNPNKPRDLAGGAVVLLPPQPQPQSQHQPQQPPASECCVRTKRRRRRRRAIAPTRNACLSAFAIGLMLLSQFAVVEAQSPAPSDVPSLIPTRTAATVSGEPTPVPIPDTADPTTPPDTTPEPTPRPSGAATRAPVATSPAPTAATTDSPTAQPNPAPTTPKPARRPTRRPSTPRPTPNPTTFSPTAEPTTSPQPTTSTKQPTLSPRPTSLPPTSRPTPSRVETEGPSQESTLEKVSDVVSLKLTMEVMAGLMRNRSVLIYEQETTNFIKSSILTQDFGDAGLTYLFVDTIVASQKLVAPSASPSSSASARTRALALSNTADRNLQQNASSLGAIEVLMDVQVDYRSTNTDYSAAIWVGVAFNSASKRASYIAKLVATKDPTFASLETLTSVLVDGSAPIENPDTPSPAGSNGAMVGIIVGSVVGGILLVALAVVGVKRMGGGDKGGAGSQGHYPTTATTGSPPVFDNDPKFTTEIVVERQDDISTIGDPFVYGGMMMTEEQRDERTASVGDNYDYANQLLRASSSSARGQSMMTGGIAPLPASAQQQQQQRSVGPVGASVLSDDDSFEQQFAGDEDDEVDPAAEDRFEVDAPPGKLGMVIDTPNGEIPVVHALKSESVLADRVEVGDHLLAVDGEDVTEMTALEVSKLISLKSDQPRVLVFGRRASASKRKDP